MFNLNTNSKALCKALILRETRLCPPGTVESFAGSVAPNGWLLCNGQIVSRTTYISLFTAIGTIYGAGDGVTTFNLPDMRGRVSVAAGAGPGLTNRVLGVTDGEEKHTLTINEMPENWQDVPAPDILKRIGDNWLKGNTSVGIKVPSAVMPIEFNVLINPLHKDFSKLTIENIVKMDIDKRIIK
jgi:hypothetical protein